MAEIANTTVFTNRVNCDTPDLLQQAFQQVVNDDDNENEFVTFLTDDDDDTQTIQLTRAQASALNLTFEVDSNVDEQPGTIQVYQPCQNDILNVINPTNIKSQKSTDNSSAHIDFNTATAQWTIDNITDDSSSKVNDHNVDDNDDNDDCNNTHTNVEALNITHDNNGHVQNSIIHNYDAINTTNKNSNIGITIAASTSLKASTTMNNTPQNSNTGNNIVQPVFVQQTGDTLEKSDLENIGPNFNEIQYNAIVGKNTLTQNYTTTHAQVLQRLPVILPSSQFIVKPTHTILKAGKSIKFLPTSSKININGNNNTNISNNATTINATINGHNTVLLPKSTLLNSVTSLLKGSSITSQVIHGNTISAQLSDSSQSISCDTSNQQSIHASPTIIRSVNGERFATSVTTKYTTESSPLTVKSQNINGINSKGGESLFVKSLQIPTQILKTNVGKLTNAAMPTKLVNVNPSIILKTGSRLKTQNLKPINTTSGVVHRSQHGISTPISILKPQTKIAIANSTKKNFILNTQNNLTNVSNIPATKIVHKIAQQNVAVQNEISVQNNNFKTNSNKNINSDGLILSSSKLIKKPRVISKQNITSSTSTPNEASKPLGSSDNPIQIIQQGHSFHSSQKLTQSQLKQIAHVLQQRSQDTAVTNEKVVYRVVFPEELDLRIRNPINLLKGRGGKRGRPKKKPIKTGIIDDESEEAKDERKKHVARTRSGRLSRPPRHIVRDYKHLHHLDFMEPDMDDSDGGYSDYNTNPDKPENEEIAKDLLTGYEGPKRKIPDHFRCPTCSKIYLGRTRMAKHFEMHPDHGSPDQLPPATVESVLKRPQFAQDPFKRKGKKRGPWAYITPEAKSERRQIKLKEALSACDAGEILKIAAKPVLNAQSIFDLMVLKSDSCLKTFLNELKILVEKAREQVSVMLTPINDNAKDGDVLQLDDGLLCNMLGLTPGIYNVNNELFNIKKSSELYDSSFTTSASIEEPPMKLQKVRSDECKENINERFTDNSSLNVSNFLSDGKFDTINSNCPEVLTALTLMPRIPSPLSEDINKTTNCNSISKLLISNTEIQNQISDNPGFQKIEMNSNNPSFKKLESANGSFNRVNNGLEITNCSSAFDEPTKIDNIQQTFIKLEPKQQGGFVKLENGTVGAYPKVSEPSNFDKLQNSFNNLQNSHTHAQTFTKGFQKIISKVIPINSASESCDKAQEFNGLSKDVCKLSDNLPIISNTTSIITSTCDSSIFGSTDNLDISKMTNYDLDMLGNTGVMDKHLIMDDKLVEQLQLDQSNLVDELVSERLKNIIPDNILDNNLINNNSSLDTELDFEALSEEFNRNTSS